MMLRKFFYFTKIFSKQYILCLQKHFVILIQCFLLKLNIFIINVLIFSILFFLILSKIKAMLMTTWISFSLMTRITCMLLKCAILIKNTLSEYCDFFLWFDELRIDDFFLNMLWHAYLKNYRIANVIQFSCSSF